MRGTYDLWLVACSYFVAVAASYAALELAGRIVVSHGRAAWAWLAGGSVAMGLGIWSMHFIGMLAFHLPIPLTYGVPITLLSVVPAILSAALVLTLIRVGSLSGVRLAMGAILLGGGIAAMHYTGMAAIPIRPAVRYDPAIFAVSVAVAIVVAFVALKLAFSLSGTVPRWKKFAAALVMAGGICAMHYTGMAAAVFAPDSICTVAPGAIQHNWLAGIVAFNTVIVLLVTVAIAFYDARLSDQNARMVEALKAANLELMERTHRAEQLTTELQASEESLRQFRAAMEISPDAIFLADRASMRYIDVNDTARAMLGYSREELLRMGPADLSAHATREEMEGAFDRAIALGRQGHASMAERRVLRRKDGSIFPIEVRRRALRSGDRNIIVAVAQDITNREQAEQELNEAHEKLGRGVKALEQRNREMALLAELGNFLISCVTVEEACNVIPKYCETLFLGAPGALYLYRASRDHLNPYASWGGTQDEVLSLKPEDCWALRRAKPHTVFDPQKDAICGHIAARYRGDPYVCVPLVVLSDLQGLLWIALADRGTAGVETTARMKSRQQLAVTLSEEIALALSNIGLRENLRQQTIRDPLTGLYNRRFLEESLNREMARCKRNGTGFGVLMLDLDHFKRFNDTFGHDAGDSVLRSVAQALQENTREGDISCRFGGEEFVVILPDTDTPGATARAERILAVVRGLHVTHDDKTLGSITVSIGLAMYPQNGETVNALVQSADKALYTAKGAGRDRLVVVE
jgi:diguanylate cyclase (GGDEF)-like protein/PAS domain S-box-containing protein